MPRSLFGTDGIRGTANVPPMTAETALKVAMAAAMEFRRGDHRHLVVIGKDTRLSGYMLEPALTAGFISMGLDVTLVGPVPTPAVAFLTRSLRADMGVMISASHNPYEDNGIKLFGPDGYKLSDEVEAAIEARVNGSPAENLVPAAQLGRARRLDDAAGRYIEAVKATFPRGLRLEGLRIVVDCANGAAYKVAPTVLWELGAEVIPVAVAPDGFNINRECGATHPRRMQEEVVAKRADIGLALDGDADRLIVCDERGRNIDGDQIMALIARRLQEAGALKGGAVVATVMSNLGLERYLTRHGIGLVRTPVGDRYVVERMRAEGYNVGGEQSGHIVLGDHGTTGDGLVAALQVLAAMQETGEPASAVTARFEAVPQILHNVRYAGRPPLDLPVVKDAIGAAEARLAGTGRLLIRKSGTEPLIRVMAEGDDADLVAAVVADLCGVIASAASAPATAPGP
jgi:phosphoglucosamine mutase